MAILAFLGFAAVVLGLILDAKDKKPAGVYLNSGLLLAIAVTAPFTLIPAAIIGVVIGIPFLLVGGFMGVSKI